MQQEESEEIPEGMVDIAFNLLLKCNKTVAEIYDFNFLTFNLLLKCNNSFLVPVRNILAHIFQPSLEMQLFRGPGFFGLIFASLLFFQPSLEMQHVMVRCIKK